VKRNAILVSAAPVAASWAATDPPPGVGVRAASSATKAASGSALSFVGVKEAALEED
jgi:hypothetical protein